MGGSPGDVNEEPATWEKRKKGWRMSCDVSEVIILATGSEVRGFKPEWDRLIFFFQSVKILSMSSFGREVKPWVPCRRFTARKRTSSRN